MGRIQIILLFCIALFPIFKSARILGTFPFPSKSHLNVYSSLMKELAKRGHQVTSLVSFPSESNVTNYKEILLPVSVPSAKEVPFDAVEYGNMYQYQKAILLSDVVQFVCIKALGSEQIKELIKSDQQFDLLITPAFFSECMLGFQHKFNIPLVQISPFHGQSWNWHLMGNPIEFASFPDTMINYSNQMSFIERVHNLLTGLTWIAIRNFYLIPDIDKQIQNSFGPDTPSLKFLEQQTSLLLLNSDVAFSYARALTPNIINVGGMHVKPAKQLPEHLQKWLDQSKNGIIYFSMGTVIKSSDFSSSMIISIVKVFKELKVNVLWKWEDDLPDKPSNIRIEKWLPQNDILGHPNVKLFITHGGLLSTQEATYHGVPLLGIPVFADQAQNMKLVSNSGNGLFIYFSNVTETSFRWAVNTILKNPSFKRTAKRLSAIYRDQPLTPLDRGVFWTEYIIRHKGAPHLRPASVNLAWYQRELLDIILFFILIFSIIIILMVKIFRFITVKQSPKHASKSKKKN